MISPHGSHFPPPVAAAIEAIIAGALIWFFGAVVFDRPDRTMELVTVGVPAVFVIEWIRRARAA